MRDIHGPGTHGRTTHPRPDIPNSAPSIRVDGVFAEHGRPNHGLKERKKERIRPAVFREVSLNLESAWSQCS